MLAHLDKGHTRADVLEALAAVRGAGITLRPTLVAFTPWTTLDDYRELLDFIDAEGLIDHVDPVQYGLRLLVPPGSLLLDHAGMQPHLAALAQAELVLSVAAPRPAHGPAQRRGGRGRGERGGPEGRRRGHLRAGARPGRRRPRERRRSRRLSAPACAPRPDARRRA